MNFLAEKGCGEIGFARTLLSFCPQFQLEMRGKGDLRGATKAELLAVGLELKVLREEDNLVNGEHWDVQVDASGLPIHKDDWEVLSLDSDEDSNEDFDEDSDEDYDEGD